MATPESAGHESITTTVGTYGHLLPDALATVADAAEAALALPTPRRIGSASRG